jgi:hypothetical protein
MPGEHSAMPPRPKAGLKTELARASANPACYDCNPILSAALVRFANAQ